MSEAQRCANVIRRYSMAHRYGTIRRGCYDATIKELERQELRITELEQQLAESRKEVERLRAHVQEAADLDGRQHLEFPA